MEIDVKVISQSYVWGVDLLMILVSLGTQDREFPRLLEAIEKQIIKGNIKEKVIVQAGVTHFESSHMEIFDLIPSKDFSKLLEECRVLICHGGVGTIIGGLQKKKPIIAAARLKEFGEHQNNHQKQIIAEFQKKHYLLSLDDFDALDKVLEEANHFVPHPYESHTKQFIRVLEDYIQKTKRTRENYRLFMQYAFYTVWALLLEILFLCFLPFSPSVNFLCFLFALFVYRFFMRALFYRDVALSFGNELSFFLALDMQAFSLFFFSSFFEMHFELKCLGMGVLAFFFVYLMRLFFPMDDV